MSFELRRLSEDGGRGTYFEEFGYFFFEIALAGGGVGVEVGSFGDGFHEKYFLIGIHLYQLVNNSARVLLLFCNWFEF